MGVPREMKVGRVFLTALLDQGFGGRIYPVNPSAREIDGLRAHPSVADIPGPVDLAIILVPLEKSLEVVRQCAAKGIKGAVLFTAGYSETGTRDGAPRESLDDDRGDRSRPREGRGRVLPHPRQGRSLAPLPAHDGRAPVRLG